jgi:hypothetical protein
MKFHIYYMYISYAYIFLKIFNLVHIYSLYTDCKSILENLCSLKIHMAVSRHKLSKVIFLEGALNTSCVNLSIRYILT